MARRRDPAGPDPAGDAPETRAAERSRRETRIARELVELETDAEGIAGEGVGESGTLPGSVGGTTGEAERAAGTQSPGATAPPVRGIDPVEARTRVGRFSASREDAEEGEEAEPPADLALENEFPEESEIEDQ